MLNGHLVWKPWILAVGGLLEYFLSMRLPLKMEYQRLLNPWFPGICQMCMKRQTLAELCCLEGWNLHFFKPYPLECGDPRPCTEAFCDHPCFIYYSHGRQLPQSQICLISAWFWCTVYFIMTSSVVMHIYHKCNNVHTIIVESLKWKAWIAL